MKPKKRQNKKRIVFILSAILVGVIVVFLPFIVEKLYYTKAPLKFFEVSYEAKDFLSYYGSVLSFAGATILGILTLLQNKKAQEKSDEVNRLQLELQILFLNLKSRCMLITATMPICRYLLKMFLQFSHRILALFLFSYRMKMVVK